MSAAAIAASAARARSSQGLPVNWNEDVELKRSTLPNAARAAQPFALRCSHPRNEAARGRE
jgi:hypothetical protein